MATTMRLLPHKVQHSLWAGTAGKGCQAHKYYCVGLALPYAQ